MSTDKLMYLEQKVTVAFQEVKEMRGILAATHKEVGELINEIQQVIASMAQANRLALGSISDRLDRLEGPTESEGVDNHVSE